MSVSEKGGKEDRVPSRIAPMKHIQGSFNASGVSVDDTWRHLSEGSSQERVAVYLSQSVDADSEEALCWTRSGVLIGFAQPCK